MATIKQKAAAKKIVENSGNISKTMREVGYSEKTAKNSKHLTDSKGWGELMEKHIPDKTLLQVHKEGLKAMKIHGTQDDFVEIADHPTRFKFMQEGNKLKGRHVEKRINVDLNIAEVLKALDNEDRPEPQEQRVEDVPPLQD